jgi:hypothetical protein
MTSLHTRASLFRILTRLRAGRLRYQSLTSGRIKGHFSSPKHPERLWGPPSILFRDTGVFLLEGRWSWLEAGVKNEVYVHSVIIRRPNGTKHKDSFILHYEENCVAANFLSAVRFFLKISLSKYINIWWAIAIHIIFERICVGNTWPVRRGICRI